MTPGKSELMWARQQAGGDIHQDSLSSTKPWAESWPRSEQSEAERRRFGAVKLFRVTIEEVPPEEQAAYEAMQVEHVAQRRAPKGCVINMVSSRACERGTKSCIVEHIKAETA